MPRGPGKGKTNNPNGRPKGAKNVRSVEWENLGSFITSAGAKRATEILVKLPDDQFLPQFERLLQYFKPRMKQVDEQSNQDVTIRIVDESDAGDND
jgi:hypothetical protein